MKKIVLSLIFGLSLISMPFKSEALNEFDKAISFALPAMTASLYCFYKKANIEISKGNYKDLVDAYFRMMPDDEEKTWQNSVLLSFIFTYSYLKIAK